MTAHDRPQAPQEPEAPDRLVLGSELAEMERLPVWVETLAATHGLSAKTSFAINLCLEEVVSNVIRHGYGNRPGQWLTVECSAPGDGYFLFTVDDDAAQFNPLEQAPLPAVGEQDPSLIGGQGLRLLRGFANLLEYEPKPAGNRLRIGFTNAAPSGSSH